MLIGYSVDTDILLTVRILKRNEGSLNHRILEAFKTGITMTLTSLFAILFALFVVKTFSVVLTQIFTILVIGLAFDICNTWITNVSILKWYMNSHKSEDKKIKIPFNLFFGVFLMFVAGFLFLKFPYPNLNFWIGILNIIFGLFLIFEPLIKKKIKNK